MRLDVGTLEKMTAGDAAWTGVAALAPQPLYEIPGYGSGTVAQYALYVNLRQWGVCNDNVVTLANSVSRTAGLLNAMGRVLAQISRGDVSEYSPADVGDYVGIHTPVSPTLMEFLVDECGMEKSQVLGAFGTENSRNDLIDLFQVRIRRQLNDNEYRQADLVVALGRADSYFGAASNLVKQIGKSQMNSAMGLKG